MRNKLPKLLSIIIVSFTVFIMAVTFVSARAGGGESFGDGGFDSSSSSSDWGSSSSDWDSGSYYSSSGSSDTPVGCQVAIFIAIVVFIIVVSIINKRKGGSGGSGATPVAGGTSSSVPTTNRSQTPEEIATKLSELKSIDPDFDEQKFKTHVKKVFMAVQEGWTKRDQAICRPFMCEEVYQSHQMQIENMIKNKTINVLEYIVVGSADFAKIDLGQDFHKIVIKIRASMKDYKVKEDKPDVVIEGSKDQQPPFTEYWSFIRKSNLKTKVKDGIFDKKCPNCGAPISVDVAGKCKYCNANVVNGDFDWILSEIIQKSEWAE